MKSYWVITIAEVSAGEIRRVTMLAIDLHPSEFMLSWQTKVRGHVEGKNAAVLLNQLEITPEQYSRWEDAGQA